MSSQTSEPENDTAQNTPVDVKEPYEDKDDAIGQLRLVQKAFRDGYIAGHNKGAEDGIVVGMAIGAVAVTVLLGGWWLYSSFGGSSSDKIAQ